MTLYQLAIVIDWLVIYLLLYCKLQNLFRLQPDKMIWYDEIRISRDVASLSCFMEVSLFVLQISRKTMYKNISE